MGVTRKGRSRDLHSTNADEVGRWTALPGSSPYIWLNVARQHRPRKKGLAGYIRVESKAIFSSYRRFTTSPRTTRHDSTNVGKRRGPPGIHRSEKYEKMSKARPASAAPEEPRVITDIGVPSRRAEQENEHNHQNRTSGAAGRYHVRHLGANQRCR